MRCWQQAGVVLAGRKADVVVSDMAPNLSGIASADAARMAHLIELAIDFAQPAPEARGRAGGQAVPRQRLRRADPAVQGQLPDREAHQTQGVAGQILRNLPGRHRPARRRIRIDTALPSALWRKPSSRYGCLRKSARFRRLKSLKWAPIACPQRVFSFPCHALSTGASFEQSVVFQSCRLARHRDGVVHCVQAVRHPRCRRRRQHRLLRLPRGSPRQPHQERHHPGRPGRQRDRRDHQRRPQDPHHRHLPRPRPGRRPDRQQRQVRRQAARRGLAAHDPAGQLGPDAAADRRLGLLHATDAGRRQGRRLQLRQEQGPHARREQQPRSPSPTSPAATRPRKKSRKWSTS